MRVPRKLGQVQPQVPCERSRQIQAAICDGGQRADGSAKLKHQNLLARMAQAFAVPFDGGEPAGHFEPESNRRTLLQPSAPHEERGFVGGRKAS